MSIIKTVLACAGIASVGYSAYKGVRFLLDSAIVVNNAYWDDVRAAMLTAQPGPEAELKAPSPAAALPTDPLSESFVDRSET